MHRPIHAAAVLLLVISISSCVSPRPLRETSPVRIGMYADLSSTGARDGNDALKGAELRVDVTNETGGIGGRPIELVVRDMKQNATEAVKAFSQLVQEEGVCAVIGSVLPNSGLSVSPVAELSKVPLLSLSTDDRVTNPDMKPENPEPPGPVRQFAFLLQPSATQMGASFAGYAVTHFMMKRYATLYDPANPLSVLQAHAFENVVRKYGMIIAASVSLPDGDLTAALRELRDAGVDAVYVCASTEKDAAAARGIREALPQAVLLGNQAWYAPPADLAGDAKSAFGDARSPFGDSGNSAWFCMPVSPDDPGLADIAPSFVKRFGEKPRPATVPGWDAAGLIIAAVRKAGTSTPARVRDALEQMTAFQALQGQVDMDRKTHRPAALAVAVMRIVAGAYVTAEARYVYKPPRAP
jgi:branched-chain amino acid transport system substrate-binding protein